MILVARYVDQVGDRFIVREDPFSMLDIFTEIEQMQNADNSAEVKLDGKSIGRIILAAVGKANLDTAACIGQGYDKASAMAGETAGPTSFCWISSLISVHQV